MQTAVAYARFSSDNQRQESITAQLRAIRDYAKKNSISVVQEFTDEAVSGTSDDRPAFLAMIDALKNGLRVDLVLVHKLDRFARNRYDAAVYRREIKLAGARLVAVDQPMEDTPEGDMMAGFLETIAEYYSRNLAREVMKGLKENALAGKHTGGRPPLGYKLDAEKKLIIDEAEAETVRFIFRSILDGKSYSAILEELNSLGARTRNGKPFGKNSLHDLLKNEKYAGTYVYNRTPKQVKGQRNGHSSKSPEDVIKIPGAVPAIVTREDFDLVQEIMQGRKHATRRRKDKEVPYLLTGKVFCASCGSAMVGDSGRNGKGYKYRYYTCNRAARTRECDAKRISKQALESTVLRYLQAALLPDDKMAELADKLAAYAREKGSYVDQKRTTLTKTLAQIQAKLDRVVDRKRQIVPTWISP